MINRKVEECILFVMCRAGMYPFQYKNPLMVFFEKLMKQNKLKLDIPSCGNDLIEYLKDIINDMKSLKYHEGFYCPIRDYDHNILTYNDYLVLERILYNMIKESRKIYENSQDSCYYVDSVESNTSN